MAALPINVENYLESFFLTENQAAFATESWYNASWIE